MKPPAELAGIRQPSDPSGLVGSVRMAREGSRNGVLYWAACTMRDEQQRRDEAEQLLVPAAAEAGLAESEARATVWSAYRAEGV